MALLILHGFKTVKPIWKKLTINRGAKMKIGLIYLMLLFLSSCGQSSSDAVFGAGSDADADADADVASNVDGLGAGSSSTNMEDLDVSRDFDFIGGETLNITIINEGATIERRYLNICSDFIDDNGEFKVSYESCHLRTSLEGQRNEFKVVISSNQNSLIAQVWSFKDGVQPLDHHWSRLEVGNDWQITLF
jgi:hypothetical protein